MLIAYDLRYAADHFTGIGTHAFALFEALLGLPGGERYAVLWDPRLEDRRYGVARFAHHPRVHWTERAAGPLHPLGMIAITNWLREIKADVYLSPYYLRPPLAPCPCLLTIHDVWPLRLEEGLGGWRGWAYRLALAWARGSRTIVTSSEFSRREIVELLRMPEERVRAIRLGVPPRHAQAVPRRPARAPAGPFALVVGDNRPRKNLATLARAWALLGEEPALELVSVGPADPRYASMESLAADAGARRVTGLGWVEEPELEWLYAHATLVLFPTRYEGFGFPLVEAFVRGLPVVASGIPVLREIGEGACVFLDPDDPGAWAAAFRRLAGSGHERETLVAAGRVRARELRYEDTARATLELLHEAAGSAGRSVRAGAA
jgi:glycosyltransferase involved in cell wall biosynthesis